MKLQWTGPRFLRKIGCCGSNLVGLLLVSFFLLPITLKAQKIRFADTTNIWGLYSSNGHVSPSPSHSTSSFTNSVLTQDTFTYRLLQNAWVSEDTLTGRVFAKSTETQYFGNSGARIYDTSTFVLYDYGLAVGDSLMMPINYGSSDSLSVHVLQEIDSLWINNTWHRVQYFRFSRGFSSAYSYKVIEGIGSTNGPLCPTPSSNHEVSFGLYCFEHQGTSVKYNDTIPLYNSCDAPLAIEETDIENNDLHLYPNPATSVVFIRFGSNPHNDYQVQLYDPMGRKVHRVPWTKHPVCINTAGWNTGSYLVLVTNRKGMRASRRLVLR